MQLLVQEMRLLSEWAQIKTEDYDKLMLPPNDHHKALAHEKNVQAVYDGPFQALLLVWNKLPLDQWETTRAIGRDMPEWLDLRAALIEFRKAIRNVRKSPRKKKNEATESQSPQVPQ
jgi:hypothetical protein